MREATRGHGMHDSPQAKSSVDAVRCLYLARVAEREGYPDAARRWEQRAARWLEHLKPAPAQHKG